MANGTRWESSSVKAQLRLATLKLGQLQEKKDSQGSITRRDIATLLQQRNIGLARVKAQNLQREDAFGDLLEVLEMHVGQLIEQFNELDQSTYLTPNIVEAASTVIYAAPHIGLHDLNVVSSLLRQHLGPEFTHSALTNRNGHVASIAIQAMAAPPPSAHELDNILQKIASDNGVDWTPEPLRQDILTSVSEILDLQSSPIVDLPGLRRLCCHGIPDEPTWLRPRIWKLFFGILPVIKASWGKDIQAQRDSYYDLTRRLLDPFFTLPPPTSTTNPLDATLLNVSEQLSSIPSALFGNLTQPPSSFDTCPLNDAANDAIKLRSANNLDIRLHQIRALYPSVSSTPMPLETTPESAKMDTPAISLSSPDINSGETNGPTTVLISSKPVTATTIHPKHLSALRRLLYLHASINPGNISPNLPSLLVPLYVVCNQEVLPEDLAHVEADTFWLFEAMIGEFSELEDEEGGNVWMKKFSDRLAWADFELFSALQAKSLDPALPHFSYQWLASLLTHTLPFASVLPVWDALFARPTRTRNFNPKVEHLLDVCTSMLLHAKAVLFRLGKKGKKPPSLWAEEESILPPPSPLRAWELTNAFMEGVAFLELYPVEVAGGIDRILQGATDLSYRREKESRASRKEPLSLSARIKVTMWKGFTNQDYSPGTSPEESEDDSSDDALPEDGNETETPVSGLTSRLATTVWRGITNQTSMEPPPSPAPSLTASTPLPSSENAPESIHLREGGWNRPSILQAYADRLKDSDTVAAIAKASSNWRAKSILGSWGRSTSASDNSEKRRHQSPPADAPTDANGHRTGNELTNRRGSSLSMDRNDVYSPPPRPQFFRPPRDSFMFPGNATLSPEQEATHDEGLLDKRRSLQLPLSLTRTSLSQVPAKSGPRPLLLNPSTSLTSPPSRPVSRSAGSTPAPERGQWADITRLRHHNPHRDSVSSASSLSPSDALRSAKSNRSDWGSDTGTPSRRIPLNRKSISPMAPSIRARQGRPTSASSVTSSDPGLLSPPFSDREELHSSSHLEHPASPALLSHGAPKSLKTHQSANSGVQLMDLGTSVVSDPQDASSSKKLVRRILPTTSPASDASDSSVAEAPARSPRLRSNKRHTPRPLDLNLQDVPSSRTGPTPEKKQSSSNSLGVDWPSDDHEMATTPRASSFKGDDDIINFTIANSSKSLRRTRKVSTETQDRSKKASTDDPQLRVRKISSGQRPRKLSNDQKGSIKRRESSADEGDDEGYDDLLSAYESENSQAS